MDFDGDFYKAHADVFLENFSAYTIAQFRFYKTRKESNVLMAGYVNKTP
jgi:hypothetical protein